MLGAPPPVLRTTTAVAAPTAIVKGGGYGSLGSASNLSGSATTTPPPTMMTPMAPMPPRKVLPVNGSALTLSSPQLQPPASSINSAGSIVQVVSGGSYASAILPMGPCGTMLPARQAASATLPVAVAAPAAPVPTASPSPRLRAKEATLEELRAEIGGLREDLRGVRLRLSEELRGGGQLTTMVAQGGTSAASGLHGTVERLCSRLAECERQAQRLREDIGGQQRPASSQGAATGSAIRAVSSDAVPLTGAAGTNGHATGVFVEGIGRQQQQQQQNPTKLRARSGSPRNKRFEASGPGTTNAGQLETVSTFYGSRASSRPGSRTASPLQGMGTPRRYFRSFSPSATLRTLEADSSAPSVLSGASTGPLWRAGIRTSAMTAADLNALHAIRINQVREIAALRSENAWLSDRVAQVGTNPKSSLKTPRASPRRPSPSLPTHTSGGPPVRMSSQGQPALWHAPGAWTPPPGDWSPPRPSRQTSDNKVVLTTR